MAAKTSNKDMIMVAGVPRSGTSWVSRILSMADSTTYYYEPDNEHNSLLGYIHKQDLHRFPYLRPQEEKNGLYTIYKNTLADRYMFDYSKGSLLIKKLLGVNLNSTELEVVRKCHHLDREKNGKPLFSLRQRMKVQTVKSLFYLFQNFERHNKTKGIPLIKSVHSILALPYLQSFFDMKTVLILRHPANIVSSHLRLDNQDIYRNIFCQDALVQDYLQPYIDEIKSLQDPLEKAGSQVAAFYHVLAQQLQNHPEWIVVNHEQFCREPLKEFHDLYNRLGLKWSEEVEEKISEMNRDGEGYTPARVAERQINKWKRELEPEQVKKIQRGYSTIKPSFYKELAYQQTSIK